MCVLWGGGGRNGVWALSKMFYPFRGRGVRWGCETGVGHCQNCFIPSEKGSTIKGKKLLPIGSKFLLEYRPLLRVGLIGKIAKKEVIKSSPL